MYWFGTTEPVFPGQITLKSESLYDLTTRKLNPVNNTNTTDPPNKVEEAKPEVVNLVDIYLSAKMIGSNNDTW